MGRLLVLEGLDGSGKSTQMELLKRGLAREGFTASYIKMPDYESDSSALVRMYLGGAFGESPDDVNAYAASTFYAADRYAGYHTKWQADYQNPDVDFVVADRYVSSNAIFQMPKLSRELWDAYLAWLEDFEYRKLGLPRPDMVIYLDVPVEISQKLLSKRYGENGGERDVHERDIAYQMKCREAAEYAANASGWKKISCAEDGVLRAADDIAGDILDAVRNLR
ncbi:MAG: thymidylate kinase [Acutalibacteraceae bacterium]|jgi:dTMP kinase|nr:thymidylate kinase [Acutalibacteraceae bacterium]